MSSAYRGPTGKRVSLIAAAQSPGSLDPGRGSASTATSSTAKDAGTSSMPPPSVPSSALTKAATAGSAASSQESTAGQAPAAKGPPVPKIGGMPTTQGPPVRPASDSAVTAKSGAKDLQATYARGINGKVSSSKEASSNWKAEVTFEFIESQGSICLSVQYNRTRKGSQSTNNYFAEGLCNDNYWNGKAGTVFFV